MQPFGSALIAVACRISSQPEGREHAFHRLALFGRQVCRTLASIQPLRNSWHFTIALRGQRSGEHTSKAAYAKYLKPRSSDLTEGC